MASTPSESAPDAPSPTKVLFFDIDNCLYPKSAQVQDHMAALINQYIQQHLALPPAAAARLHAAYYRAYGLALAGLVRHHAADPLAFDAAVDAALPLERLLAPRPALQRLLAAVDRGRGRGRVRPWLFTNARAPHARRVVRLLGVAGPAFFDGLTACDYARVPLVCKPHRDAYVQAMRDAGVAEWGDCYFVDDNYNNCAKAHELGWHVAHLVEDDASVPKTKACEHQIRHLDDLKTVFPELFKTS